MLRTNAISAWTDPRAAAQSLASAIRLPAGWDLQGVRVARVFPGRPEGVAVEYELALRHSRHRLVRGSVYLSPSETFAGRGSDLLNIHPVATFPLTTLQSFIPEIRATLHTPDRDDLLPGLSRMVESSQSFPDLCRIIKNAGAGTRRWRCLSYRAGRRCTLAYSEGRKSPYVVGKMYRNGSAVRIPKAHRAVAAAMCSTALARFIVPTVLGTCAKLNVVIFEGLPPRPGSKDRRVLERSRAAGRILRSLHALPARGWAPFAPADELQVARRWVRLADLLGRTTPAIHTLMSWLDRAQARLPAGRRHLIHRDFYDAQILESTHGWALLDLDTLAAGDIELDLGNFLAHLIWTSIRRSHAYRWHAGARAFLPAYLGGSAPDATEDRLDHRRLRFYTVASLLRLGIIHMLRSGSETAAAKLHRVAQQWAQARDSHPPYMTHE